MKNPLGQKAKEKLKHLKIAKRNEKPLKTTKTNEKF